MWYKSHFNDALANFLKTMQDSIILPMHQNLNRFRARKELLESKRFHEMKTKLDAFTSAYGVVVRHDVTYREKIVEALRVLNATRMTQFLERGRELTIHESEAFRATLLPYTELLEPIEDIRRLQLGLLSQAKLKKMPIAYDEIMKCLTEVAALISSMPKDLEAGLTDLSEKLVRVA